MKTIILLSSIFYILGLKLSNQIDLEKKEHPIDTVVGNKIMSSTPSKNFEWKVSSGFNIFSDTLRGNAKSDEQEDKMN